MLLKVLVCKEFQDTIVSKGRTLKSSGSNGIRMRSDHAENPLKPVSVHRGHLWEVQLRVETCQKHFHF